MKILNIPVFIVTTSLLATTDFAGTMSVTDVVKSVNTKGDASTMEDRSVYTLTEGFEAGNFKAGEKGVIFSY